MGIEEEIIAELSEAEDAFTARGIGIDLLYLEYDPKLLAKEAEKKPPAATRLPC